MGFMIRKSINLGGGFRINISKSGVGYSWGVPGYRITKTARGTTRKTYSIPHTGISYVSESQPKKVRKTYQQTDSYSGIEKTLDSGDISNYQTAEYQELLDGISNYKRWNMIANVLICSVILCAFPFFIFTTLLGIALKIFVLIKLPIPLTYSFDDETACNYESLKKNWLTLNSSRQLWQLITSVDVRGLNNQKRNAGASALVSRQLIRIMDSTPRFFKSNIKFITLRLKNEQLYLMPDKVLIVKGRKVGAVSYADFHVAATDYHFIESNSVPKDADTIGYTWAKVNKDGSPDKRFKGNRKLPICNYGLLTLTANVDMDIRLCCSNNHLIDCFREF